MGAKERSNAKIRGAIGTLFLGEAVPQLLPSYVDPSSIGFASPDEHSGPGRGEGLISEAIATHDVPTVP
jgi:hypothetical protein